MTAYNHTPPRPAAARIGLIIAATLAVMLVGCSEPEPEPILDGIDYRGWRQTTSAVLNFPVPGHGDSIRVIYASDATFDTDPDAAFEVTYPDGALLVKDGFRQGDDPETATPFQIYGMLKAPDDPRSRGGWVWFTRDPIEGTETIFNEEYCVTCHANANEQHPYGVGNDDERYRDYVFHSPQFEARGLPDR